MKKLLFKGDIGDARKHISSCKIKSCKTCQTLKAFIKRCEDEEYEQDLEDKDIRQ